MKIKYKNVSDSKIFSSSLNKMIDPGEEIEIESSQLGNLYSAVKNGALKRVGGDLKPNVKIAGIEEIDKDSILKAYENKPGISDALRNTNVIIGDFNNPKFSAEKAAEDLIHSIKKMEDNFVDPETWSQKSYAAKMEFIFNADKKTIDEILKFESNPAVLKIIYTRQEQLRLIEEAKKLEEEK